MLGEVALEEVFVEGEVLNCGAALVGEVNDSIDEEEWVAMREDFEEVGEMKHRFALRNDNRWNRSFHFGMFFLQERCHF